jgi:hypothetical protein
MSGYTSGDFEALSQAHPGVRILHKPWSVTDLLRAVRAALDEEQAAA